ncbi:MAG: FAD-dependent thymidylate synthase [Gammaproteobacteria bacterium]|nr:FAD-dependent thymidylate synthase [Gammaproteobacteria bacterium]
MKIINQSWEWLQKPENPLAMIEKSGRTCYKSENRITQDSAKKFVAMLVNLKHEAMLEHAAASVRFVTNRGVTHELVRHRLASFAHESTRYVKYLGEMEFIKPVWWDDPNYPEQNKEIWRKAMLFAEDSYHAALKAGDKPEQAREILPHSIKTEIVVTANLREWLARKIA